MSGMTPAEETYVELQQTKAELAAVLNNAEQMRAIVNAAIDWRPLHGSLHNSCRPERCGQKTCTLTRVIDAYLEMMS